MFRGPVAEPSREASFVKRKADRPASRLPSPAYGLSPISHRFWCFSLAVARTSVPGEGALAGGTPAWPVSVSGEKPCVRAGDR